MNMLNTGISLMLRKHLERIAVIAIIATHASSASAALTQWRVDQGGNGHFYEVVSVASPIGWDAARVEAETRGGHLATLTSAAENDFVGALVHANGRNAFLGGFQIDPSAPANVGWSWVTGEAWSYTNWAAGEPNDQGSPSEWVLEMWSNRQWNDVPNAGSGYAEWAYVVEVVPAPSTALLTLLGLGARARRRTH
jgi:hypothetical protein